jgi:hypothetical protein
MVAMKPPFPAWGKLSRMHSLVTLSVVVVGVIAVLAALFAFLNLRTARTYRPTVDQIVSVLDAVLARGSHIVRGTSLFASRSDTMQIWSWYG